MGENSSSDDDDDPFLSGMMVDDPSLSGMVVVVDCEECEVDETGNLVKMISNCSVCEVSLNLCCVESDSHSNLSLLSSSSSYHQLTFYHGRFYHGRMEVLELVDVHTLSLERMKMSDHEVEKLDSKDTDHEVEKLDLKDTDHEA